MGVLHLWKLLGHFASHLKKEHFASRRTVAVDLAGVLCAYDAVLDQPSRHILATFKVTTRLLSLGLIPVFVLDAEKPSPLKLHTVYERRRRQDEARIKLDDYEIQHLDSLMAMLNCETRSPDNSELHPLTGDDPSHEHQNKHPGILTVHQRIAMATACISADIDAMRAEDNRLHKSRKTSASAGNLCLTSELQQPNPDISMSLLVDSQSYIISQNRLRASNSFIFLGSVPQDYTLFSDQQLEHAMRLSKIHEQSDVATWNIRNFIRSNMAASMAPVSGIEHLPLSNSCTKSPAPDDPPLAPSIQDADLAVTEPTKTLQDLIDGSSNSDEYIVSLDLLTKDSYDSSPTSKHNNRILRELGRYESIATNNLLEPSIDSSIPPEKDAFLKALHHFGYSTTAGPITWRGVSKERPAEELRTARSTDTNPASAVMYTQVTSAFDKLDISRDVLLNEPVHSTGISFNKFHEGYFAPLIGPSEQVRASKEIVMQEVAQFISLLNLPCFRAVNGVEAEAVCSRMNAEGIASSVISEDSDVLLFGSAHMIRIFGSITAVHDLSGFQSYDMDAISQYLSRYDLVFLSLFLGSDFCPGVRGIGIVLAMEILCYFGYYLRNGLTSLDDVALAARSFLAFSRQNYEPSTHCSTFWGSPRGQTLLLDLRKRVRQAINIVKRYYGPECEHLCESWSKVIAFYLADKNVSEMCAPAFQKTSSVESMLRVVRSLTSSYVRYITDFYCKNESLVAFLAGKINCPMARVSAELNDVKERANRSLKKLAGVYSNHITDLASAHMVARMDALSQRMRSCIETLFDIKKERSTKSRHDGL